MGWDVAKLPAGVTVADFVRPVFDGATIVAEAETPGAIYYAIKTVPEHGAGALYVAEPDGSIVYGMVTLLQVNGGVVSWKRLAEFVGPHCPGKCPTAVLNKLSAPAANEAQVVAWMKSWRARQIGAAS